MRSFVFLVENNSVSMLMYYFRTEAANSFCRRHEKGKLKNRRIFCGGSGS
jgi:hypothetical protein